MKSTRIVSCVFACLLYADLAAAGETPVPETGQGARALGFFDPVAPLLDAHQWTVVRAANVQFGKDHPDVWVQLLKSLTPTGQDGVGRPLYSVNLVVAEAGRLLYSFAPRAVPPLDTRRMDPVFYMDDRGVEAGCPLELRDVTGDKVPEIIFHSGWAPADNSDTDTHILQYTRNGPTRFRDIRVNDFTESNWTSFRWLDLDGHTVAIVAEPAEPSTVPGAGSQSSPRFHEYRVYRWDQMKGSFVLSKTIPSTRKLHDEDEDPLRTDWAYIVAKLRNRRR